MTKEEYLQNEILKNYRSVMAFAKDIGIPYTTIKGVLSRGVDGASVQTVIKVCDALGVDIYYLFRENFNNTEKNLHRNYPIQIMLIMMIWECKFISPC